jgi:hypothetical protein
MVNVQNDCSEVSWAISHVNVESMSEISETLPAYMCEICTKCRMWVPQSNGWSLQMNS